MLLYYSEHDRVAKGAKTLHVVLGLMLAVYCKMLHHSTCIATSAPYKHADDSAPCVHLYSFLSATGLPARLSDCSFGSVDKGSMSCTDNSTVLAR